MCVQVKTDLADLQFLFCDIVLVTLLAIVMGKGGPSTELHHCRPPASLLALPVLGSLFIHTCMNILGQLGALFITTSQDWSVQTELLPHLNILWKHFIFLSIFIKLDALLIHCKTSSSHILFLGMFHSIRQ